MKIRRSVLERIIKEELAAHIKSLTEGPGDQELDVVDAEKEKKGKEKKDPVSDPKKPGEGPKSSKPPAKELPVADEPEADQDLEQDVAGDGEGDDVEDAEEVTGGKIADQVTGKTIQSVTMEPKSKTLPGAQEIVLTFKEIPDPLKILITKTGTVKFFFRGLHNEL